MEYPNIPTEEDLRIPVYVALTIEELQEVSERICCVLRAESGLP